MLNSKNISVVMQGAIAPKLTQRCLQSIRTYLPDAQIILSTWEGSNVANLDYDVLVLNSDPGCAMHDYKDYVDNNTNRQLLSTQKGIEAATNSYVLKLRTDLELKSNNFLLFINKFPKRNSKYSFFENRVLCSCLYSVRYSQQTYLPLCFHPSDFWFFGLKKDIEDYFLQTRLLNLEELSHWQVKYPNKIPNPDSLVRYAPEQYFCYSWAKRHIDDLEFYDWTDWNDQNIEISNHVLLNNFIFLDPEQSGIHSEKHNLSFLKKYGMISLITFTEFKKLYVLYCDTTTQTANIAKIKRLRAQNYARLFFFLRPIKQIFFWLIKPYELYKSWKVYQKLVKNIF